MLLNLKIYFTGKPCKKGHISPRYTIKSSCIECLKISAINRKEKIKQYNKERYHSLSPEKLEMERIRLRNYNRDAYNKNPDKFRKRARDFHQNNKEKRHAYKKEWSIKNYQKIIDYRQIAENKAKSRFFTSRRRASFRTPIWANLEKIKFIYANTPIGHHVDHIVPLFGKHGGLNIVCGLHCEENLQYLLASENQSKNCYYWPSMP